MPLRLGADDRHLRIEISNGALHISNVRHVELAGVQFVSLVDPIGHRRIVSDHDGEKSRMSTEGVGQIIVFHDTDYRSAVCDRFGNGQGAGIRPFRRIHTRLRFVSKPFPIPMIDSLSRQSGVPA